MSDNSQEVVIVAAKRTPVGSFNGALASLEAHQLGSYAITAALQQCSLEPQEVDEVVLGHILTSAQGQNTARQAAMHANIPHDKTALAINQLCGSGLRSVAMGYQSVKLGENNIVVAGGQESMSRSRHASFLRQGVRMGDATLMDTMMSDGLTCAFNQYHMGVTAENIAEKWQISRQQQDTFACNSQNKTQNAQENKRFLNEITPVKIVSRRDEKIVDTDEYPKLDTTIDKLASLRPAFKKEGGSVTAGNSSGINDGAAALVLMSKQQAKEKNLTPLATIVSWATAGVDPAIMGTGPIPASQKALKLAKWSVNDLDLVEANEAFAVQALAVVQELNLDANIVNVNGGAIALGHPIGASGARVLVTLIYEMIKQDAEKGLATLCIGGGMGIAMCIQRS